MGRSFCFDLGRKLVRQLKSKQPHTYLKMSTKENNKQGRIRRIEDFKFSPFKLLDLPIETIRDNYVRPNISRVVFSRVDPTPLTNPKLVSFSGDVLTDILDMDPSLATSQGFADFIAGNKVLDSSEPLAHRYGGHQFGFWAMQLGDGRALLLGEFINSKGERWELQLKGAGLTPYSRGGDGRAVLRSSIREYLCSEAMYYLGIPTSRAGAIIVSEDKVVRDLLYDGHPQLEPTSVVLRIAPSWFRIGSLELLAKTQETDVLSKLINFVIKEHFPTIPDDENKILNFLKEVFRSTADLVVAWQAVGFTHGVLNTDNISLLGITIDYGPFGFMEDYDPLFVPNHSDSGARYCYGQQTKIILFNLMMLTKAVTPFLKGNQMIEASKMLQDEAKYIDAKLQETLSLKLGLKPINAELVNLLINMLEETKGDFAMVFRELSETPISDLAKPTDKMWALKQLFNHAEYHNFVKLYQQKFEESGQTDKDRREGMCKINPCYILRNWMAENAIQLAHTGDFSEVNRLLKVLKTPFNRQMEAEQKGYAAEPPSWSRTLCLSCSS